MWLYIGIMFAIILAGEIRIRIVWRQRPRAYKYGATEQRLPSEEKKETRKIFVCFFLFIFWVLTAFRGSYVGNDTAEYIGYFNEAQRWVEANRGALLKNLFISEGHFELGYVVLCRLVALLLGDVQWLFTIVATFILLVLYKWIEQDSWDSVLSVFLFISLRFLYFIMSGMRQAIAMFICVLAFRFIKKRKLIPFLLMVLLATQFHLTAVLFLIAYPLSYLRFTKVNVAIVTAAGLGAFFLFGELISAVLKFLPEYYSRYEGSAWFAEYKLANIVNMSIQFVFLCTSMFSAYRFQSPGRRYALFTREYDEPSFMQFMILLSVLMSIVAIRATTLDRLSTYFWLFSIIYIPNMMRGIRRRTDRNLLRGGAIMLTMIYNTIVLYYRPEWNGIVPYRFFWQ